MSETKKRFPKIKKKLKWFLTDESWKITKKDAMLISSWFFLLWLADNADWALVCSSPSINHSSGIVNGHYSWTPSWTSSASCSNSSETLNWSCGVSVNHSSGIVNGHYSWTPSWTTYATWECTPWCSSGGCSSSSSSSG